MSTKYVEARIREAHLLAASPEIVWAELQRYGAEVKNSAFFGDTELEKSLLARSDPLIDLALARYGCEHEVVASLYKKSFSETTERTQQRYLRGLRLACLSNRNLAGLLVVFPRQPLGEDEQSRLINEGDEEESTALFANPLAEHLLEALYAKKGEFASVDNERWRRLVMYSAVNPRLTDDQSNEHGPDLLHYGVHRGILSMLRTAPTTYAWVVALRHLFIQMDPAVVSIPDAPILDILERWTSAQFSEKEKEWDKEGHYTQLSQLEEFRCLVAALYGSHYDKTDGKYTRITDGDVNAADVAVRCAYYGNGDLSLGTMNTAYARDKDAFVLALLFNKYIFHEPDFYKFVEQGVLHGPLYYFYKRRREQIASKRKRLLDDEDDELVQSQPQSQESTLPRQISEALIAMAGRLSTLQNWVVLGFVAIVVILLYKLR